ncbi:MAG: 30S ribosomal protein S17 [Minisyncoccales bacterium]
MKRQTLKGIVVSDKRQKTITVLVKRLLYHPLYKRNYRLSKKYHVHDEKGEAKVGDLVEFELTRPLSKTKRWRLTKIIEKKDDSKKDDLKGIRQ